MFVVTWFIFLKAGSTESSSITEETVTEESVAPKSSMYCVIFMKYIIFIHSVFNSTVNTLL